MRIRDFLILIFFLGGSVSVRSQQLRDEVSALRYENAVLRSRIDSLERVLNAGDDDAVLDTWSQLEDLWDDGLTDLTDKAPKRAMLAGDEALYGRLLELMGDALRVPWDDELRRYVDYYTHGKRARMMPAVLGRYERRYPEFKAIFDRYGVPEQIIPLCIVESAISPRARSVVGALGVWQFMPQTAQGYNMRVDELLDERMDIRKSTIGAAQYLSRAYKNFGRWDLAVLSYNCGAGNIQKAIIRAGGKTGLWEIYDYLPNETKGYFPSLIAALYVVNCFEELGLTPEADRTPVESAVLVTRSSTFTELSQASGLSAKLLHAMNPQLLTEQIPAEVVVAVPMESFQRINALFAH